MIKYIPIYVLFLTAPFCTSLGQNEVIGSQGPTKSVRTIRQDKKGNIWLATNEGIIRYDGRQFANITGKLSTARFFSLIQDKKGNFWFGTDGAGVYCYNGKSFQHFTTKEGLVDDFVFEIYEDKAGNIWFGTKAGLSRYDGKSFHTLKLLNNDIYSIIEDRTGKYWFGTRGGTYIYDGKISTVFKDKDGNDFKGSWSIIEDKKGNIWLSGYSGLWRYDGKTYVNFTTNSGLFVYEDKKGNIWNGGSNGDGKFVLSRYAAKTLSDKKPLVTQIAQSTNLFRIFEANDGSIWFGATEGVYRYDGSTVSHK